MKKKKQKSRFFGNWFGPVGDIVPPIADFSFQNQDGEVGENTQEEFLRQETFFSVSNDSGSLPQNPEPSLLDDPVVLAALDEEF